MSDNEASTSKSDEEEEEEEKEEARAGGETLVSEDMNAAGEMGAEARADWFITMNWAIIMRNS
jgi:hypothetical protein